MATKKITRRGRTIRSPQLNLTLAEYLSRASVYGGTDLERIADNAAQQLGRFFDDAQVTVQLAQGAYTRIDRVLYHPLTAVFLDGIQHDLRPDIKRGDDVKRMELEGKGWRVFSFNWKELVTNPIQTIAKVWYG